MAKATPIITDKKTGKTLWTAEQAAKHCGCSIITWRSYLATGRTPEIVAKIGTVNLWYADEVKQWHADRPRAGKKH